MGAVQALLTATGAALLRRRIDRFRHHVSIAAIFAGLGVACAAIAIGFLGGALYALAEREIGPVAGGLAVGLLAAALAVIALVVVRAELRAAVRAGGLAKPHDGETRPALVEAGVVAHGLAGLGKKPDALQLAALVAVGIVVGILGPHKHR
jgi:hypothetical protein